MAYYYITSCYDVYKTVGARKVKKIIDCCFEFPWDKVAKNMADEIEKDINNKIINNISIAAGITPSVPIQLPIISFISTPVQASTRKLNAKWTIETEQDIKAFSSIKIRRRRNTIPIHKFKLHESIIRETSNFYDVIFELSMKNLN